MADENLKGIIIRSIQRADASIDIVRVQDVGLRTVDDPAILEWAAQENRIVITHDFETMPGFAFERVEQGDKMPGVIAIKQSSDIGRIIEDMLTLIGAGNSDDVENQVIYMPL